MLKPMKVKCNWYAIWFAVYVLMFFVLFYSHGIGDHPTLEDLLFPLTVAIVCSILSSGGLGLVLALVLIYEGLSDLWMYLFNESQWLLAHMHAMAKPGNSFEHIVSREFLSVVVGCIIILHFVLSVKRCKEKGLSVWRAFIPLYNPFALFRNKVMDERI